MRRWYQNIDVGDSEIVYEGIDRKESKFWNEGKWNNFIKPLLPKDGRTFIEIGCNAGLFLKMAIDTGFKDVIGIEASGRIMDQAKLFKKDNKYNYKLIQQTVGKDFEIDKLPIADVVLFSNVHYYFPVGVFSNLVDRIKNRTTYCIVVGARAKRRKGNAVYDIDAPGTRGYFKDWEEIEAIGSWDEGVWKGIEEKGDLAPREKMYGILFKGGLSTVNVDNLIEKIKCSKENSLIPALEEFFEKVFNNEKFDYKKTLFYQFWRDREPEQSSEWIYKILDYKKSLAEDIQANGMKEPIYLGHTGGILDGIHRLFIAKALGYEHIIVKKIINK